jgi:DNA-binding NarL/FixJ family response regulator
MFDVLKKLICMKVIIADDSKLIIKRLQEIIGNYKGIELVGSYYNGTDALKALRNLKPELAILDIKMPGYTGLEVLQKIRKENKEMKIIIFTLFSSGFYRHLSIKEGADYFFSKVDEYDKIHLVLEKMLSDEKKLEKAKKKKSEESPIQKTK